MDLLEREPVLETMHRLLREAGAGQGCLILLGGEAGVGKSALLRRFITELNTATPLLLGQCDALSTPRALGPLFDMAGADPVLKRLLDTDTPRDRLFRAVLDRLRGAQRAIVLAIEDVHWADEATFDLLRFLGRRIEDTHGLAIITYRDDEVGPHHAMRQVLGDLATTPAVHRLTIPPLSAAGVAAMVAGSGIDPAALYARTRGNPFFVTEVLAAVGDIPATVRDAVLARAGRLPLASWSILEAAAVIGSPIDPRVLRDVTDVDSDALEALVASGIVIDHGATLTFRHELAREAILSAISPSRRVGLHDRLLHVLETSAELPRNLAQLAHHAEQAGDGAAVLRYAPEAARRAGLFQAHREEADQYARALRFAGDLPHADRARLLEAQSYASYLTAQIDRAMTSRAAALALWHDLGDARKEGENRCHLANLLWAQAKVADAERQAETAVALTEQGPAGPELAMAYGTLARLRGSRWGADEALRLGEQAIVLAERVGALDTRIDAIMTVGEAHLVRGDLDSGQAQVEHGMRLSTAAGFDALTARGSICLGYGFAESGHLDDARSHFEHGIAFCLEHDLDLPRYHMMALLARYQFRLGNWDHAEHLAAAVLGASAVAPATRFDALLVVGRLRVRRGEHGASPLLDEALDIAAPSGCISYLGPIRVVRAEAAYLRGDSGGTVAEADAAYGLAVEQRNLGYQDELAYWRFKGGAPPRPPAAGTPHERLAAGEWQAAATAWDTLAYPYEAAWARGEGSDETALREALGSFERLGAQPAAALVRGRLRQLGIRHVPRGPRPATRANPAGLTRREIDVVALLAHGHSNQEIAGRLFLSPRTVENHVAAILTKLGAASRAEAVAAAMSLDIVPQTE